MKKLFLLIAVFSLFLSCEKDENDCLCTIPPPSFSYKIIDADTNENLYTTGTLDPDDIKISKVGSYDLIGYKFISENDINAIELNLQLKSGDHYYKLELSDDITIDIRLQIGENYYEILAYEILSHDAELHTDEISLIKI